MTINLYFTKSPNNFLNKDLELVTKYQSFAIVRWDLDNPTFRIGTSFVGNDKLKKFNYLMYFTSGQAFYYFIKNKRQLESTIVEIDQHVDVLMTYKDQILNTQALIDRQENDWNMFIQDPMLQVYQNQIVQQKLFPNKIDENNFILSVAGG